jgi:DNA polymerase-3 subunit delta'
MQFSSVPGHNTLKQKLTLNVREGRVPHAQLLLGNDGYGLLPMALAYAQYLFCQNKGDQDSCGVCDSCLKTDKISHPDLHFSFPFKKIAKKENSGGYGIEWREQVLETPFFNLQTWNERCQIGNSQPLIPVKESDYISGKLSLKSFEGGYKVLIMWHAELLNAAASNKLLKLIEEPPPGTVILLLAEQHDQLLKTITSRTQLVKVNRIVDEELAEFLVNHDGIEPKKATSIVNAAEGSYLNALKSLNSNENETMYFEHFSTWMRICYQKNVLEAFNWADEVAGLGREHQKQFLSFCLHMSRQCILGNYTNMQMVSLQGPEREFLDKFARFINHNNVVELAEEFNTAHYHIERNANAKIVFTDLSIKVIRLLRK